MASSKELPQQIIALQPGGAVASTMEP